MDEKTDERTQHPYKKLHFYMGAVVAQSVWRLAMGWKTEDSEFESR
jgi:hypothetical protein